MNLKKAFPVIVVVLILAIAAVILFVLFQDGTLKAGSKEQQETSAVVLLVVENTTIRHEPIADFNLFIADADIPVFVDFWAAWCGPCRLAAPFIEQLASEYQDKAHIVKVDVDQAAVLARQYNAQSIPQFSVFKDGKLIESSAGYADSIQDSLRQMIEKQLP